MMTNTKLWYPWKNPSLAIALQSLKITAEVAKAREKIPNCKLRMTTEGWAPVLTNISKQTPANPEEKQATRTAIRPAKKNLIRLNITTFANVASFTGNIV